MMLWVVANTSPAAVHCCVQRKMVLSLLRRQKHLHMRRGPTLFRDFHAWVVLQSHMMHCRQEINGLTEHNSCRDAGEGTSR